MKFEGIYTPAITPLDRDGAIDRKAFAAVLEHLIAAKVHGIIVAGSTGEYYAHTAQERTDLAAYAKEVIGVRLPLIVGTGAIRTEDSVAYARHAREIGADAILVASPPYAVPSEEENAAHALAIDKAAGLPIMLYNYPGRMGVMMGEDYFARVSKSKNVIAIKESSGDLNQLHMLARRFPNIALSCGWDDLALEFFAWGAPSWVCAGSNFLAAEHIALYEACVVENDFAKGRKIMSAMLPLMNNLDEGNFVQKIKYGAELAGFAAGNPRLPLLPLGADDKARFAEVVSALKAEVAAVTRQPVAEPVR
ncbi:MAG: dihydrodipicolinate synthase family protein [Amaricoccus sp.]